MNRQNFYKGLQQEKVVSKQGRYLQKNLDMKVPSAGSVDNKFAICAAEASKPSQSSGPFSEISPTSNPVYELHSILSDFL